MVLSVPAASVHAALASERLPHSHICQRERERAPPKIAREIARQIVNEIVREIVNEIVREIVNEIARVVW